MVSLKKNTLEKEQQVREYTPVHLIDEAATIINLDAPSEIVATSSISPAVQNIPKEEVVKEEAANDDHKDNPDKKHTNKIDAWEVFEIIIKSLFILLLFGIIVFVMGGFLSEGLQLAKQLAFNGG